MTRSVSGLTRPVTTGGLRRRRKRNRLDEVESLGVDKKGFGDMAPRVDFALVRDTFNAWNEDKAPRLAAALSFSTIFSIAPLLIIVIAIAGTGLALRGGLDHPHGNVEAQLLDQIRTRAGTQAADAVRDLVAANFSKPHQGIIAQIIGWVTFIVGASGVFASLQDSLNTVWHVEPTKQSMWLTIRQRIASLGMVVVIGFLILATFGVGAALAVVSTYFTHALPFPGAGTVFSIVNYVVSLALMTVVFAVIYKILPDAKIDWSDVWTGSAITAVLFVIGQALIGLYLAKSGTASAYGAAGSLLVLLLWIYYSAMTLFFGAEFTKIYARRRGKAIAAGHQTVVHEAPRPAATATAGTAATPPRAAAP
jgi:membrane protein